MLLQHLKFYQIFTESHKFLCRP